MLRALILAATAAVAGESLHWSELPVELRPFIAADEAAYMELLDRTKRSTVERIARGEDEHLIYYVLQSQTFTKLAPIEPSTLAALDRPSAQALDRMRAFAGALSQPSADPRMRWWQQHLPPQRRNVEGLDAAYTEAMRFLRAKEIENRGAPAYRSRGHSSDTSLASSYIIWHALGIVAGLEPGARLNRVLVVGPGLDFAPRTGYRAKLPLQSYQPFLTAQALLEWKLAASADLEVTAADANPRVLAFIHANRAVELPEEAGGAEFTAYLRGLGREYRLPRDVRLDTKHLDVLSQPAGRARFDLVIATNLLLYFNDVELALAIANISSALRPGGYFIHNEARPVLERMARAALLPAIQGRTLEIARGTKTPLVDTIIIHRRR